MLLAIIRRPTWIFLVLVLVGRERRGRVTDHPIGVQMVFRRQEVVSVPSGLPSAFPGAQRLPLPSHRQAFPRIRNTSGLKYTG